MVMKGSAERRYFDYWNSNSNSPFDYLLSLWGHVMNDNTLVTILMFWFTGLGTSITCTVVTVLFQQSFFWFFMFASLSVIYIILYEIFKCSVIHHSKK